MRRGATTWTPFTPIRETPVKLCNYYLFLFVFLHFIALDLKCHSLMAMRAEYIMLFFVLKTKETRSFVSFGFNYFFLFKAKDCLNCF